jgi:hypothetical protein
LAKPFAICLPAVSKHLKVLERAGLVLRGRSGGRVASPPSHSSRLPTGSMPIAASGKRSFDHLGDYLAKLQTSEKPDDRDA